MVSVRKHTVHVHVEVYERYGNRGDMFYIVRFTTQPAGDTSGETVRSNMKIHRCHRLHTEKEERVMLSLVSAYLVWSLVHAKTSLWASLTTTEVWHFVNAAHIYLLKITEYSNFLMEVLSKNDVKYIKYYQYELHIFIFPLFQVEFVSLNVLICFLNVKKGLKLSKKFN